MVSSPSPCPPCRRAPSAKPERGPTRRWPARTGPPWQPPPKARGRSLRRAARRNRWRTSRKLSRPRPRVCRSADARADEVADTRDGLLGLVQHRPEPVPDVDHRGPFLDLDVEPGRARPGAETERVVEQHLVAAHLDEQRREIF